MKGISTFSPRTAAGLSLVELMIAITLVSIILAGVVKLYSDSHRSFLTNEGVARTQESIRYVLDHISRSAARAGYLGCMQFEDLTGSDSPNVENLINVATDTGRLFDFVNGPVFGTDDGGANNSDTLVLRSARAADGIRVSSINPVIVHDDDLGAFENSGLQRGDVVVLSDCKKIRVFMMTNDPSSSGLVQHAVATIDGVSNVRDNFLTYEPADENQQSVVTLLPASGDVSVEYSIGDSAAGGLYCRDPTIFVHC